MDQVDVIAEMRAAAGSRQKLAEIAGVAISTAQAWEKGVPPKSPPLSRLNRWRPDLTAKLMDAIAAADDARRAADAAGE
jgi:transcriptional regulator with XRE-family HTH domain